MECWNDVRRQLLTNALSHRTACRRYGLGWRTLTKILAHELAALRASQVKEMDLQRQTLERDSERRR